MIQPPVFETTPTKTQAPASTPARSASLDSKQRTLFECRPFYQAPAVTPAPASRHVRSINTTHPHHNMGSRSPPFLKGLVRKIEKRELDTSENRSLPRRCLYIDDEAESCDEEEDKTEQLEEDGGFIVCDDEEEDSDEADATVELEDIGFIADEEDYDNSKNLGCLMGEASGYQDSEDVLGKLDKHRTELFSRRRASKEEKASLARWKLVRDKEKRNHIVSPMLPRDSNGRAFVKVNQRWQRLVKINSPEFRQLSPTNQHQVVTSTKTTWKQRKQEPTPNIPAAASAASVAPNGEGGGYDSDSSDESSEDDKPIGPFKPPEEERDDLVDTEDER